MITSGPACLILSFVSSVLTPFSLESPSAANNGREWLLHLPPSCFTATGKRPETLLRAHAKASIESDGLWLAWLEVNCEPIIGSRAVSGVDWFPSRLHALLWIKNAAPSEKHGLKVGKRVGPTGGIRLFAKGWTVLKDKNNKYLLC